MASGTCPKCQACVPIAGREPDRREHLQLHPAGISLQFYTNRQLAWSPLPHKTPDGKECDGAGTEIT